MPKTRMPREGTDPLHKQSGVIRLARQTTNANYRITARAVLERRMTILFLVRFGDHYSKRTPGTTGRR
jgi:hypothetical protein